MARSVYYILRYSVLSLLLLAGQGVVTGQSVVLNEVVATAVAGPDGSPGQSADWVELHNPGTRAVQLGGFILSRDSLADPEFVFPDTLLVAGGYLLVRATDRHLTATGRTFEAPFRIRASGQRLYLFDARGLLVDWSPAVRLRVGQSGGRYPDGAGDWMYFEQPTPAAPNVGPGLLGSVAPPSVSAPGGYYTDTLTVTVTAEEGTDLHYTTDGGTPTEQSPPYITPLAVGRTTTLRVRAFRPGHLPSEVVSRSYIFAERGHLPTVSLIVDPQRFTGPRGIYRRPKSGEEIPVHLTFLEADTAAFALAMGMKIHAPDAQRQKSLRLYARSGYGRDAITYPLFPGTGTDRFRRLVLRNGGNDGTQRGRIQIKDAFAHRLYKQLDDENAVAAYRPVRVLLNGHYYGLYNLRERQDEHYLESHFGYGAEEVDFLEYDEAEPYNRKTISGDWTNWDSLRRYVTEHDLAREDHFAVVDEWIDLDNFIDYQIFEIFIGNQDWLSNNTKFWRPRQPEGKWRWVLWDTEYGMGTQIDRSVGQPDFNFLGMALSWGGWGDDDWTWLLRNLMDNSGFRERFTGRYLDLLNSLFLPDYLLAQLDSVREGIEPELGAQLDRWGSSLADYEAHYDHTRFFLAERRANARANLLARLDTTQQLHTIRLDTDRPGEGEISINTLTINDRLPGWQREPYPWRGEYPRGDTLSLRARPRPGYRFSHWEGDTSSTDPVLRLPLGRDMALRAVFTRGPADDRRLIVLNEIMTSNGRSWGDELGRYGDWFELHNPGDRAVDLAGLYLTDDPDHPGKWRIPDGSPEETTIGPGAYLTFFADGMPERGARHVGFRLDREGEYLGVHLPLDDNEWELMDAVTVPALDRDWSLSRQPDAYGPWVATDRPTPEKSNSGPAYAVDVQDLVLYPNPARDRTTALFVRTDASPLEATLYGPMGRVHRRWTGLRTHQLELDLSGLPPAVYVLRVVSPFSDRPLHRKLRIH